MTVFQNIFGEKKNQGRKKEESFVIGQKVTAPKPIPKLDLGFGCRYRNQVSVVHY